MTMAPTSRPRELDAEDRDDWDRGVAEAVAAERLPARQALGARGADEVFALDVDDRRADVARQHRGLDQAERDGRQDQRAHRCERVVGPVDEAAGGQDVELDREDGCQQQACPERGYRDAQQADRRDQRAGRVCDSRTPAMTPRGSADDQGDHRAARAPAVR